MNKAFLFYNKTKYGFNLTHALSEIVLIVANCIRVKCLACQRKWTFSISALSPENYKSSTKVAPQNQQVMISS